MGYRPDDWDNPHTKMEDTEFANLADAHFRQLSDDKYNAYEAGADAMLEVLSKDALLTLPPKMTLISLVSSLSSSEDGFPDYVLNYTTGKKCKLVLIPDDETLVVDGQKNEGRVDL